MWALLRGQINTVPHGVQADYISTAHTKRKFLGPYPLLYVPTPAQPIGNTRPVCQSSSFFTHHSSTCSPQTCRPMLAPRIVAFRQLSPAGLICRDDSCQACQRHARPNVNPRAPRANTIGANIHRLVRHRRKHCASRRFKPCSTAAEAAARRRAKSRAPTDCPHAHAR